MLLFRALSELRAALASGLLAPGDCVHVPDAMSAALSRTERAHLVAQAAERGARIAGGWGAARAIVVHRQHERAVECVPARISGAYEAVRA